MKMKMLNLSTKQLSSLQKGCLLIFITFVLLEVTARLVWGTGSRVNTPSGETITLLPLPLISPKQADILERWANTPHRYIQFDPILGWRVRPNAIGEQDGIIYTANSVGMRSLREYSLDKPAGVLRIATFGPSFTHGDEAADDETWQVHMEQARPELEVMNWGVGGYGTDQAFLRYRLQGIAYQPDIVIIGFEEDNVRRNVNRFRPFFRPGTGTPLTKPVFVEDENQQFKLLDNPFKSVAELQTALDNPTHFLNLVCEGDFFCDRRRYETSPFDGLYSVRFMRTLWHEIGLANQQNLPTQADVSVQRINFLLLQQFVSEVVQNGSTPVILIFPEQASMEVHERGQPTVYAPALTTLRDQGLFVIDLAPAFVHAKTTENGAYLDYYASDGGHFNGLGNYIVSQTVLGALCQAGLLTEC